MKDQVYFTRWLAAVGVFGGVAVALVLPYLLLVNGQHLAQLAQIALIVLAILGGIILAGLSAVVGIAVPHRITGAALAVNCRDLTDESESAGECCSSDEEALT